MKTVTDGNSVKLHYKGTFPDGEVFDDSRLRGEAMNILVGQGRLLPSFESALIGMAEGEVKSISLTSEEAYGDRTDNAVVTTPKSAFPENFPFEVGLTVQGTGPAGQPIMAKILSFDDGEVVLDHNHPLAGKDINFEIELVQIEETSETETATEE
jgi:peptidylprolyl isomerase